jgi:hypothetical protein
VTSGLVSALTCFSSVVEAAVGGASRVHLYCLCSSSEQGTNVSDSHNIRTNYFTYLAHTHLGGRSATCWEHLGGSHNERGTVATHTQVSTA